MLKNLLFSAFCLLVAFSATGQNVVFSEDFANGFDGNNGFGAWETVDVIGTDNYVWEYNADSLLTGGAFIGDQALEFTTAGNGFMHLFSDRYLTGGNSDNLPAGPPYGQFYGELISPVIDLSASTRAVNIEFTQFTAFLNVTGGATNRSFIEYSFDGGATWESASPIVVNEGRDVNTLYFSDELFPGTNWAGSSQFRMKFVFTSDLYIWAIDDIRIVERENNNDLRAQSNFFAIAPNAMTPADQVEEFSFLNDILNLGAEAQYNVTLEASVADSDGNNLYTATQDYGTLPPDSLAENVVFGAFTPPATAGTYTGTYTLSSDSTDNVPDDNTISFDFMVSDSVFAKETGATRDVYPATNNWATEQDPRAWAYGNVYHVVNGDGLEVKNVEFGLVGDANNAGSDVEIRVYEWNDANADGDFNVDERENNLVGFGTYTISGNESQDDVLSVEVIDFSTDERPKLKDDTDYVVAMEFRATDLTEVRFASSEEFNYGAAVLASEENGAPRYSSVLGISSNLDQEDYSSLGFGRDIVPVIRMTVGAIVVSAEEQLPTNAVTLSPNPASDFVNVAIDLPEMANIVNVNVFNSLGQLVNSIDLGATQTESVRLDVANLPAGKYFVFLQADTNNVLTKSFVKK